MWNKVEFTSITLPAQERCLDPQLLTLAVSFSIRTAQSILNSFLAEIGAPKYLKGTVPIAYLVSCIRSASHWGCMLTQNMLDFDAFVHKPEAFENVFKPLSISRTDWKSPLLYNSISFCKAKMIQT